MSLRDKIKVLAMQNKISVAELERTLGFGNGSISKWNKQSPSVEKLKQVADFFHVSIDYLLGREEEKELTVLDRVKGLAKKQGISIVELEEKLGFGRNSLYAWKNKMPSNDKLIKVADFFHVSVDYLLGREEVKTPSSIEIKDLLGQSMTFEGRELTDEEKVMIIEIFKAYLKTKK